jgi:ubiquinone/menaquinone biosynthesis C-methylase UbiE
MKSFQKQWNQIYKDKGASYASSLSYWNTLIELFKKNEVKTILDIGCGSGNHLLKLAKEEFLVYGIDSSREAIKLAKKRFAEEKLKGNLKVHSMHKTFPFSDNFFDAIISLRTLNHGDMTQIKKTIQEIKRVIKKNGCCFISSLFIPGRKKQKGVTTLNTLKVKMVKPRTYVPLEGKEEGVVHFLFNKKILLKLFKDFQILKFWIEYGSKKWERYYCLLAKKIKN